MCYAMVRLVRTNELQLPDNTPNERQKGCASCTPMNYNIEDDIQSSNYGPGVPHARPRITTQRLLWGPVVLLRVRLTRTHELQLRAVHGNFLPREGAPRAHQ